MSHRRPKFSYVFLIFSALFTSPAIWATGGVTSEMLVVLVESRKQWCDQNSPGFKERSDKNYTHWRRTHESTIESAMRHSGYNNAIAMEITRLSQLRSDVKANPVHNKFEALRVAMVCHDELLDLMGGIIHPQESFSSPSKTLDIFTTAVMQDNHELAVSCLTSESIEDYINNLVREESLQDNELDDEPSLKDSVAAIRETRMSESAIDDSTIELRSMGDESLSILFKRVSGNWKIAF